MEYKAESRVTQTNQNSYIGITYKQTYISLSWKRGKKSRGNRLISVDRSSTASILVRVRYTADP